MILECSLDLRTTAYEIRVSVAEVLCTVGIPRGPELSRVLRRSKWKQVFLVAGEPRIWMYGLPDREIPVDLALSPDCQLISQNKKASDKTLPVVKPEHRIERSDGNRAHMSVGATDQHMVQTMNYAMCQRIRRRAR